ncbi:hypothetical protein DFH29DRAFT_982526 [Suillus ampliporus]|nr:hypothetical protein DFH29DRAFT_982526 [Suillus ampliporus]
MPCPTCATQFVSVEDLCTHLTDDPCCNGVPVPLSICQPAGPGEERTARYHENSGSIYSFEEPNTFDRMRAHDFKTHRTHNVYYPFADREEWELAKFLSNNLNQGQITQFLKLLWVKAWKPPAYTSAQQMFTFMDALPKGPKWRCMTIHTEGYITTHPVHLIWRNALEVTWHIFGNPVFANDMEFDPYEIQDQLPPGTTIVPIVLASDKTPVTRQSGGLKMHPIHLDEATAHAWSCIAYMPILQFVCHPDFCSLLQARVWHQCIDIVCENLKITAATGTNMVDPSSHLCYVFTPPHPWKVQQFQEEAKALHLSGVQLPFWRDWRFGDPALFLSPDILHTLHKFFFDHILKWCKEVLGADELDSRFRRQHKCIGTHHFAQGVSHIQQMTGREHRDIQRTIVATITGVVDVDFIHAVRALINFIYQAQSSTFTPSSITDMNSSLAEFHRFKGAIVNAEARRGTSGPIEHFEIPKLELLASFGRAIPNLDCLPLDREDTARQFDLYALLRSKTLSLTNLIDNEFKEVVDIDPAFGWIMRIDPENVSHFQGPRPIRNHFIRGLLSEDSRVAFHVTVSSDLADNHTMLPDFPNLLRFFIEHVNGPGSHFQTRLLNAWNKFHLQLHSDLRPQPCDAKSTSTALLYSPVPLDVIVGQVRMVFGLSMRGSVLPPQLAEPLLYVQLFKVISCPQDDPAVMMYHVRRRFQTGPDGTQSRLE